MSRSRRHTPIAGNTKAESEKRDKQLDHRRLRRTGKRRDNWTFSKDGRNRFDPGENPELMRK